MKSIFDNGNNLGLDPLSPSERVKFNDSRRQQALQQVSGISDPVFGRMNGTYGGGTSGVQQQGIDPYDLAQRTRLATTRPSEIAARTAAAQPGGDGGIGGGVSFGNQAYAPVGGWNNAQSFAMHESSIPQQQTIAMPSLGAGGGLFGAMQQFQTGVANAGQTLSNNKVGQANYNNVLAARKFNAGLYAEDAELGIKRQGADATMISALANATKEERDVLKSQAANSLAGTMSGGSSTRFAPGTRISSF